VTLFVADSSGLECIYRLSRKHHRGYCKIPLAKYSRIHVTSETMIVSKISKKFIRKHVTVHKVPTVKIIKLMSILKVDYEVASAMMLAKRLNAIFLTANKDTYIKAVESGLKAFLVTI